MSTFVLKEINGKTVDSLITAEPSLVMVCSSGGQIDPALVLLAWLEHTGTPVIIAGQCSSAALYLLSLKPSQVTIMPHTYGIQHAPSIIRDPDNHARGIADCWHLAASEQWDSDRPVYETLLGRELSVGDAIYLRAGDMQIILNSGALRARYIPRQRETQSVEVNSTQSGIGSESIVIGNHNG